MKWHSDKQSSKQKQPTQMEMKAEVRNSEGAHSSQGNQSIIPSSYKKVSANKPEQGPSHSNQCKMTRDKFAQGDRRHALRQVCIKKGKEKGNRDKYEIRNARKEGLVKI
jgi:hypothetical protein